MLHYAGDGLFSYEEDAYNPANFAPMIERWMAAAKRHEQNDSDCQDLRGTAASGTTTRKVKLSSK